MVSGAERFDWRTEGQCVNPPLCYAVLHANTNIWFPIIVMRIEDIFFPLSETTEKLNVNIELSFYRKNLRS